MWIQSVALNKFQGFIGIVPNCFTCHYQKRLYFVTEANKRDFSYLCNVSFRNVLVFYFISKSISRRIQDETNSKKDFRSMYTTNLFCYFCYLFIYIKFYAVPHQIIYLFRNFTVIYQSASDVSKICLQNKSLES